MENKGSFGAKCGKFFGNLVVGCIAVCLSAVVIAATIRFIMWLI